MKIHFTDKYLIDPTHPITVHLVGVGGTGSQMLVNLAKLDAALVALGHKGLHVTAFDDDKVDDTNIGRQLFFPPDINKYKSDVLVSRVNRSFGLEWISAPVKYSDQCHNYGKFNILITCVDKGSVRKKLFNSITRLPYSREVWANRLYWLDTGNTKYTGQVVLGTWKRIEQPKSKYDTSDALPSIVHMFPEIDKEDDKEEQGPSCSTMEALNKQDLFINNIIATFGSDLLWKLFKDYKIENHGVFINMQDFNTNPIPIK